MLLDLYKTLQGRADFALEAEGALSKCEPDEGFLEKRRTVEKAEGGDPQFVGCLLHSMGLEIGLACAELLLVELIDSCGEQGRNCANHDDDSNDGHPPVMLRHLRSDYPLA